MSDSDRTEQVVRDFLAADVTSPLFRAAALVLDQDRRLVPDGSSVAVVTQPANEGPSGSD